MRAYNCDFCPPTEEINLVELLSEKNGIQEPSDYTNDDFSSEDVDNSDVDKDFVPYTSSSEDDKEIEVKSKTKTRVIKSKVPADAKVFDAPKYERIDKEPETMNPTEKARPKKRLRQPHKWARNTKKAKINSGHLVPKLDGTVHRERTLKKGCEGKCKLKCSISEEARTKLFDNFWKLGNITSQREFINRNTSPVKPKYRRTKPNSKKSLNMSYSFIVNGEKIKVCKKMFMATLGVGNTMISTAFSKSKDGFIEGEKRGKHGKQKKLSPETKEGVRIHINSIPRIESHYVRADTKHEYFEGSLNISTLYRKYVEMCKSETHP